ncbi:MAG TPA: hypothetical protein VKU36_05965, partial [Candidatus Babeliales bacterium]|nr:hypothetical protein [Candidatus Babeliales bacterium]
MVGLMQRKSLVMLFAIVTCFSAQGMVISENTALGAGVAGGVTTLGTMVLLSTPPVAFVGAGAFATGASYLLAREYTPKQIITRAKLLCSEIEKWGEREGSDSDSHVKLTYGTMAAARAGSYYPDLVVLDDIKQSIQNIDRHVYWVDKVDSFRKLNSREKQDLVEYR